MKDTKERVKITEDFIFKRTSEDLNAKAELRDQLTRVDELL